MRSPERAERVEGRKIAIIGGDGTGPEVVREGLKVLAAVSQKADFKYETVEYDLGGARYLKTKELVPDSVLKELEKMDAIFLGAIGHPDVKPGILEQGILLKLRFSLDQYINLRPVKLYNADFIIPTLLYNLSFYQVAQNRTAWAMVALAAASTCSIQHYVLRDQGDLASRRARITPHV